MMGDGGEYIGGMEVAVMYIPMVAGARGDQFQYFSKQAELLTRALCSLLDGELGQYDEWIRGTPFKDVCDYNHDWYVTRKDNC